MIGVRYLRSYVLFVYTTEIKIKELETGTMLGRKLAIENSDRGCGRRGPETK